MKVSRSMTWVAVLCLCIGSLLFFGSVANAQSTTDGAIGGTIMDASGAAVAGAKGTAKNIGTNAEASADSDDTGYFRIPKLPPAQYIVTIAAQGFAPYKAEQVVVQIGSVTEVNPRLNVASAGATV